jgi:predicted nucleic acid-binding protein
MTLKELVIEDLRALGLQGGRAVLKGSPIATAADLYQACRAKGAMVQRLMNCLIAAVALSENAIILHNDNDYDYDFESLARHTGLRAERYRVV